MIKPRSCSEDPTPPGQTTGSHGSSLSAERPKGNGGPGGRDEGEQKLDEAFDVLERAVPERVAKLLRWLRHPKSRWVRIPLGLLFIGLSMLWFLPVIGIELLPLGLLLIAQDIPFLRKPMAKLILWLERKWRQLLQWWRERSSRKRH